MKFKSIGFKAVLASLAVTGAMVAAPINPAQALSLRFSPTGTSLDLDPIKDIKTSVGSILKFNVFLETGGLADDDILTKLGYNFAYDPTELGNFSFTTPAGSPLAPNSTGGALGGLSYGGLTAVGVTNSGGSVLPNAFNQNIGQVAFKVLKGLKNDGKTDFLVDLVSATGIGGNFTSIASTQIQVTEVQPKPIPTPALLPGLIAMGVGMMRKRKAEAVES